MSNGEGMLTSTNGAQYVYDALQQRVEKTGGSNPTEAIYFNGHPVALLNPSSGAWTDLIWAGNNLLGEVAGSQTAVPVYRLLDHEGSLVATTDGSGNVTGSNLLAPYGQLMASNTNDPYSYTNLFQDTEYGGDSAWYRNYSAEQSRWLRPDPYNGSYDLMNPQSFNRYMYVNGNPLAYTDPSGLADGVLTGVGGSLCSSFGGDVFNGYNGVAIGGFKPCDPTAFILSYALTPVVNGITSAINGIFNTTLSTSISASEIAPVIGAAFAIGCSIESSQALCGPPGWTSVIPGNWGKVTADSIATAGAVAGVMCATGNTVACGVLFGYAIYTAVTDVLAGLGLFEPPQFTGSLLPRPSDLGGLGTSPIGIPNQNLTIKGILGQPSRGVVQSPGMNTP